MIRIPFPHLYSLSALRSLVYGFGLALMFSTCLSAQIDGYSLLHQQQAQSKLQAPALDCASTDCDDAATGLLGSDPDFPALKSRPLPNLPSSPSAASTPAPSTGAAPTHTPSEPPNEFQHFVQSSTGKLLPIYGAWLFDGVPSTFAPLDHIPVTPEYTIGPNDEIDMRVWGQINFNQRFVVDRSGDIFLPQVGRVSVAGLRFAELHDNLKSAMARLYHNFELNVNMGQLRSMQIFIVGQARRPGSYTVSSLSTLVNALFVSGGPSSSGSMREIQLKRAGTRVTTFDLYDLLLNGDKSNDVHLHPGDVIFIPTAGPRVAICGSVQTAAIYEFKPNTSLREALIDAGGLSPVAAAQHAILERIDQHSTLRSDNLELNQEGLRTILQNGDIIQLQSIVPRLEHIVTLRGNVADPVRLPWRPGMKISDIIPDKASLLTRNYWSNRNRLEPEPTLTAKNQDQNLPKVDGIVSRPPASEALVQLVAPDIDWNYAVIERRDPQKLTTQLIPFNLGKVAIDHDPTADLPLQPGDVITVFSQADITTPRAEQTKYVRLEGEIKMAGVYSVEPGEHLRDLVARAGGLSPNAYLYGAQFTRESTKHEQQERYNEFVDQLEREVNQDASTLVGRVTSTEQAATAQASFASQRAMISRLRQAQATGRIVLDLQANSEKLTDLPNIPLENGDRLFIPAIPSTVNVVGTVYNQSAFLYNSDLRLAEYLHDSGGPTRFGDKNHIFVIRADGSVISKDTRSGLFSGSFDSVRMYPGDSIVVPANTSKVTRVRSFLDWSQVISNFGLGAAAINVLK
jgi:polysaccharide biosynthesis/export protein